MGGGVGACCAVWERCQQCDPPPLGQVHEVLILNSDRGSVICWDFDIMKWDVAFSVLRTKVPITNRDSQQSHSGWCYSTLIAFKG